MDILSQGFDSKKSEEGVWIEYQDTDIRFRIARFNNPKYREMIAKLGTPHRMKLRHSKKNDIKLMDEITLKAACHTILLDWDGVDIGEEKDVPYSPERAIELFSRPELRHIYDFIIEVATDEDIYLQESIEDAEGNS